MKLKKLVYDLSICKLKSEQDFDINKKFYFMSKTDEEISAYILIKNENFEKALNILEKEGYEII